MAESVLRVRDSADPTGAAVYFEIGLDGEPTSYHTNRPRLVGKNAVDTKWVGKGSDFRLWNGIRMAHRLDVWWEVPGAPFSYYRSEVTQCERAA